MSPLRGPMPLWAPFAFSPGNFADSPSASAAVPRSIVTRTRRGGGGGGRARAANLNGGTAAAAPLLRRADGRAECTPTLQWPRRQQRPSVRPTACVKALLSRRFVLNFGSVLENCRILLTAFNRKMAT